MTNPTSYAYDAAMHCADCADASGMTAEGAEDSDGNPVGAAFSDEADTPQHCDDCGVFLENALTDEGVRYVIEELQSYEPGVGRPDVLREWAEFYEHQIEDEADIYFSPTMFLYREDVDEPLLNDLLDCGSGGQDNSEACEYVRDHYCVVAHPDIANYLIESGAWDWDDLRDQDENVLRSIFLMGTALNEGEPFCADFQSGEHPDNVASDHPASA